MKKIKLAPNNAFLGAEVSFGDKTFYVVKVNEKSFYASEEKDFLEQWKNKQKGITWKNFCEGHKAKSYKYGDFEITEEEASKKDAVEAKMEIHKTQKKHLTGQLKKEVHQSWKRFIEKESKGKGKAWSYPIHGGDKTVHPIAACSQSEAMLLHINDDYVFYFVNDDVYVPFERDEHKMGKEIVWPVSPLEGIKE